MPKQDEDMAKIKHNGQKRRNLTDHPVIETRLPESGKNERRFFGKLFSVGWRGWLIAGVIVPIALGALGASLKYLEDDARRQMAGKHLNDDGSRETSLLDAVNPFLGGGTPTPTPRLSKEYIYAGGRMLAVEDADAAAAPPADLAVWRLDSSGVGTWRVMGGQGSQQVSVPWGGTGDKAVPGDYDGDGKTDFSVFRPSDGYWYIQNSSNGALTAYQFGVSSDRSPRLITTATGEPTRRCSARRTAPGISGEAATAE